MSTTNAKTQNALLKSGQLVDENHVNTLLSNYRDQRWENNSKSIGKADSLSVSYGIDELQQFMDTARKHGADAIKMYFGVYPENYDKMPVYSNRQTIVLVATKKKPSLTGGSLNKHIFIQTEKGQEILAFNVGNICPPFCKPTEEGGYTVIDQHLNELSAI